MPIFDENCSWDALLHVEEDRAEEADWERNVRESLRARRLEELDSR